MFRPELISFLKLLGRSPELAGGWREYTPATERLVKDMAKKFPGLFEVDEAARHMRPTAECNVLVKWMTFKPVE